MTFEEAWEFGRSLPMSIFLNAAGKPLMSRADWEKLPRRRRWLDLLLWREPPKGFGERPPRSDAER